MDLSNGSSGLVESRKHFAVWLAALFVAILGAKLRLIQIYATNIPYWDQWDEARMLFKPWLEGHLTWSAWVAPHNEHRIFFTRALDWLEVWLNGQWDPRLQMVVNAFIHAGFAVGLAATIWYFTGKKKRRPCLFFARTVFHASVRGGKHPAWLSVCDVFS
ncbi:MAG TPA: hypothetical protein DCQ92_02915 [Verrucomicrobia subdivision 3 bacterium]|nr:hypothetical protein [Limisphaerales bacterium]